MCIRDRHTTRQGNIWPQLSQLAEPLLTDPGLKSGISVRALISTSQETNKKAGRIFFPDPRQRRKSHHQRVDETGRLPPVVGDPTELGVERKRIENKQ